jgi:hypothetical protein
VELTADAVRPAAVGIKQGPAPFTTSSPSASLRRKEVLGSLLGFLVDKFGLVGI